MGPGCPGQPTPRLATRAVGGAHGEGLHERPRTPPRHRACCRFPPHVGESERLRLAGSGWLGVRMASAMAWVGYLPVLLSVPLDLLGIGCSAYREGVVAVVTGAGGHIGTNLVRSLLAAGREVRAVDTREPGDVVGLGAAWVAADVRDRDALRIAFTDAEVVFHLAAVISVVGGLGGLVSSTNVDGVSACAHAALDAGVPRFVHCSSIHAYDREACRGTTVTESSPRSTRPTLPTYDRSKAAGETAIRGVIAQGLDAVILNPSGVIGPRDEGPSRMGTLLLAAARGRLPATVQGDFDWVDVRDVVDALLAAEVKGDTGANYLIGGHSADLATLAAWAADAAGRRRPYADLPLWFARLRAPAASLIARRSQNPLLNTWDSLHAVESRPRVNHTPATTVLGHHPRPLRETVADLVTFFTEHGSITATP